MHESYRSLRWSWIGFGWFIAAGLTSLILLAGSAFGLTGEGDAAETLWVAVALLVGFLLTGVFVGTRVVAAPVLHGIAIGLCSLAAWIAINLFIGEPLGEATWASIEAPTVIGLLLLQTAASVVGVRMGVRWMRAPVPHVETP